MQLFYSNQLSQEDKTFTFSKEESKHIIKALRKKIGDIVFITNGKGILFTATIEDENPNKCKVTINGYEFKTPLDYKLHIAIAPTKTNDRMEWFLEKATEIGVTEITPILCDHSERKIIKRERYQKILQSATKQSLQYHTPILHDLTDLNTFIKQQATIATKKFIAHCEPGSKEQFIEQLDKNSNLLVMIGPEGDFSKSEIALALDNKYCPVSLGRNRLRTETAGIVVCAAIAAFHSN